MIAIMRFFSRHPLLIGATAGLIAGAVSGRTDRFLDRFISAPQKRSDRRIRKGTPHELAGPYFAAKVLGKRLTRKEEKGAKLIFNIAYDLG